MATVPDGMRESTVGAVRGTWTAFCTRLDQRSLWFAVAAYGVIYAVLLVSAAIAAGYLGMVIPGMAGVVVFFTGYLTLIVAARRLVIRAVDAIGAPGETNPGARARHPTQKETDGA